MKKTAKEGNLKKRILSMAMVLMVLTISLLYPCVSYADDNAAVADARSGVVRIYATYDAVGEDGLYHTYYSFGSGFGVGKAGEATDTFVTNWHVISDGAGGFGKVYIITSDDAIQLQYFVSEETGELDWNVANVDESGLVPCTILDTTTGYPDVAVIQADTTISDHVALPLLAAENADVSDEVYAIGFPGDADRYTMDDSYAANMRVGIDSVVSTDGTISRFTELASADNNSVIQHTAEINNGNSGGPLVTEDGAVIGINTYGVGESDYPTSIYIDYAMEMLDNLGISYDVYNPKFHLETWMYIVIAVAAVGIVIVILLITKMKKNDVRHQKQIQEIANELEKVKVNRQPERHTIFRPRPRKEVPVNDSGYRLNGVAGVFQGKRFRIGTKVSIGRSSSNDLVFPSNTPGVSGKHCEIHVKQGNIYIVDTNSSNGVFINGNHRIQPGKYIELKRGDRVYLGSQSQCFQVDVKSH